MDVSEGKLRGLLQDHPDKDAAELIAVLMLERAVKRQKTKEEFEQKQPDDDTEEWW
jgi:hypothetical protein